MSIQSIIRWFEIAKPNSTAKDQVGQMAYHAEEFAEMMDAIGRTDMRINAQDMRIYTSKKITVERIVTEVETYEIYPEQLEAFIDCADHRLEIDFGKPTGEFYSDKRRVLTIGDKE